MTLILNQVGWRWALQVSDRLVSTVRGGVAAPFDHASNKTVVLLTRTGIVSLSYCGLGYLAGRTTDTWIVEQVRGRSVECHPDGRPFTARFGNEGQWPSLQEALERIRAGLQTLVSGPEGPQLRRTPVAVVGVGWMFYRAKRPRPIFFGVTPGSTGYEIHWSSRVYGSQFLSQAVPGGYLSSAERAALADRLAPCTLDEAEAELSATIASVSSRAPGVGPDCMAVAISPPIIGNCHVRIRYLPRTQSTEVIHIGTVSTRVPVTYSPWLLGPNMYMAPTITTAGGPTQCELGAYKVTIEGPPTDGSLAHSDVGMFFQSQRRPRRP